ncbi:MAG: hypothetical protein ACMUEM_05635 [Flavobacteriales bacterium AspAUS03]
MLLTDYCFYRSSSKHYEMLIQNKQLAPYIAHFREKKDIPLKKKDGFHISHLDPCRLFYLQNPSTLGRGRSIDHGHRNKFLNLFPENFEGINSVLCLSLGRLF